MIESDTIISFASSKRKMDVKITAIENYRSPEVKHIR
ncbi:hypothetical protein SAMN05192573_116107 [Mucilaginibacter gossypii]|uniref:Uncharacterized protein n=1 Tax=Mucilaginibacter gossypii TaxID=551996 RepID=A0A1G8I3D6_9SPHI|nr:hypothetical protein SAMN05192573_116107 [Mucilaginibacter gossypii]